MKNKAMRNSGHHTPWYFPLALLSILVLAAAVRLYHLDWDNGTHLHPDERYLTMVVSAVRFPGQSDSVGEGGCNGLLSCLRLYWNTDHSPLNPANYDQYANYVYGTLPLFSTRALASWVDRGCGDTPALLPSAYRFIILGNSEPCSQGFYTGYGGIHLVGRSLSTLADLLALLGLVYLAANLYDRRTALLAGLLYTFAALAIQHAHFFVVDSFATVFVVWTLAFCVRSVQRDRLWLLVPAGLTAGLAIASKISVWPLVGIVGLAGVLRHRRDDGALPGGTALRLSMNLGNLTALGLAGVCAAAAFRTMQPYAFAGPGFFDVRLNEAWLETIKNIRTLMKGLQDVPYGHQWTSRSPVIFPWRNMVFWGLGLPLGLAAWVGWAWISWELIRGRMKHLLIWSWGTGFFLYQATQWVKSMRYLLPVYPVFVLFAAWAAMQIYRWGRRRSVKRIPAQDHPAAPTTLTQPPLWRRTAATLARAIPALLVVGATLWCVAFLSIYEQPVTRVTASEWLYEHVPTAVTLQTTAGPVNIPWSPNLVMNNNTPSVTTSFETAADITITGLQLTKVTADSTSNKQVLEISLGNQIVNQSIRTSSLDPISVSVAIDEPIELAAGTSVPISLELIEGPQITIKSAVIANEHWDDPLPLRMDDRDGFWNWFQGLSSSPTGQINNYDEDTVQKRFNLLAWLSEADYIVLSSNRLYASIPRLAQRYPLTTEYYRLLFNGSLGFELAAEFVSYPRLGPLQFPDQENPFPLMSAKDSNAASSSIWLPAAEEAFSVYDHPTVLVFKKTPSFSAREAEALLPKSLLYNVQWMTPKEATKESSGNSNSLLLSARMRTAQQAGGTWAKLFPTHALQNRSQRLAVVIWALLVTLLGWIAFPFVHKVLPALRCHGYGLSRVIGVLVWAYLAWLLASLHILPYTRLVLWGLIVVLGAASVWIAKHDWDELRALVSAEWCAMLTVDIVFLTLFVVWVGVRWMNPDLWHPVAGGEKPMDFAYFNAVMKSTWFPPYDPWFAGGQLNYYYFGFVMVGSLTKALGIVPSVAYNLAIPTLFAFTGVGGYVIVSNLAIGDAHRRWRAGLWGVAAVVILGNLGEVKLLADGLVDVGDVHFDSMIPKYPEIVSMLVGLWKVVAKSATLPFRPEWWYWDPTRIIPVYPGEVGPINEFPAFTYLYADLHAHAMALPLTQVTLAVALQWALGTAKVVRSGLSRWRRSLSWALPRPVGSLLLAGLAAGALRATNTWDYPTYLALMTVGFAMGLITSVRTASSPAGVGEQELVAEDRPQETWDRHLLLGLATPVLLLGCAELLFRPFTASYEVPYAAFELWSGSRTLLKIYVYMYGMFLFPITVGGIVQLVRISRQGLRKRRDTRSNATESEHIAATVSGGVDPRTSATLVWLAIGMLSGLGLLLIFAGYFEAPIAWLAVPLGLVGACLVVARDVPLRHRILWFWVGTALALSLLVEIAVLKGDIGRMNTVFKFHLQVWMLLALSGAVFIEQLLHGTNALQELLRLDLTEEMKQAHPRQALKTAEVITSEAIPERLVTAKDAPAPGSSRTLLATFDDAIAIFTAILICGAALYPAFAIPAKMRDRWVKDAPHTLDGMAYVQSAVQYENDAEIHTEADYRVIRWLQENVEGSPTIIEAQAEREYLWGNRISVYTGLPTVVAWRWHQVQQRMIMPAGTVEKRQQDIRLFYNTLDPEVAHTVLERYQVEYVILTPYERAYMLTDGLPKFVDMVESGWLEIAYQDDDSTVYRVIG